jgi:endonuclease G
MGSIDSLNNQVQTETTTTGLDAYDLAYYYPTANLNNGGIVEHLAYSLDYNEDHEQADWVFYELTKEEVLNKAVPRKDKFINDPSQ